MSAHHQVTITLGGSKQVVKRPRMVSDVSSSCYDTSLEGKRSIRERLGSNLDYEHSYENQYNKRLRSSNFDSCNNHMKDARLHISNITVSRDDLRYKLLRKGQSRSVTDFDGQNGVDLREKLSRSSRISLGNEVRRNMIEPKPSTLRRGLPPTRSADDFARMDSSRKSYPPLAVSGLRHRSPDNILSVSRRTSPRTVYDDVRHIPSARSYDNSRSTDLMTRSIPETSRPVAFMGKMLPVDASKSSFRTLPGGVRKNPYMPEEALSVAALLHGLGLGKYSINFQAEELQRPFHFFVMIDMTALRQMGDNDLKELGIPMGPRKKILLALFSRPKQRPQH